jgi:hypothetical protein
MLGLHIATRWTWASEGMLFAQLPAPCPYHRDDAQLRQARFPTLLVVAQI